MQQRVPALCCIFYEVHTMDYDFQLYKLTNKFYNDYPQSQFPELLIKKDRVYNCLLFEFNEYFICVPFRTEISHRYAYHFKQSQRSKQHKSGLDFTKIVIILNTDYIDDNSAAIVDADEFRETRQNIDIIRKQVYDYVTDYIEYNKSAANISKQEFNRRYKYSTLQYFHQELNLLR